MPKKMNLVKKLHQSFVVDKISNTKWENGTSNPLIVELDTTEACDLACPGCISEDIMKTKNRFTNKRLMEIGNEFYLGGVKGVILIGGGEPLAHPAIGDFMKYLGERNIHIGITTNGTFIGKYKEIIAEYSSWTRISMDAATTEMFGKLRPSKGGKSKFNHIVENMRQLAEIKKGKLGYSYLIQTSADGDGVVSNIHEIYQAAELARDIGCDYFEVKPSYQFREGVDHALMIHNKEFMEKAKNEISHLDDLVTDDFEILKAINLDYSLAGKQATQEKEYTTCPSAELRTLVCPSGAFVCPYWRGKDHMKIGDLNGVGFLDMWRGEQRKKTMSRLNPSEDCTFHCLRHESNLEIFYMVKMIENDEKIVTISEFDRFI
ncbi:MAG: radical SAM protein [gamma proteobacterium symbiont of Bathyaustriella thionipta]|nr:radical SAM protein [gamma proteobacterium symbiont of Bathyaustriella thionipta]